MRLLDTTTVAVTEFWDDKIPPYAILSHVWDKEEVLFQDLNDIDAAKRKFGFNKIKNAADLAASKGYNYIWIDTCCIDKTSSAELSEAINSMYTYYKKSAVCYAFLADVSSSQQMSEMNKESDESVSLRASKWFTRGWTLQELIAPKEVLFYSKEWEMIGDRNSHAALLESITNIEQWILEGGNPMDISIARKMFWASQRETTRAEDASYCLLGLFDINMPTLYGEGAIKAFRRLQEEILKVSDDQSLYAWEYRSAGPATNGLLANSPKYFKRSGLVGPFPIRRSPRNFTVNTRDGAHVAMLQAEFPFDSAKSTLLLILDCQWGPIPGVMPGFFVRRDDENNYFARRREILGISFSDEDSDIDYRGISHADINSINSAHVKRHAHMTEHGTIYRSTHLSIAYIPIAFAVTDQIHGPWVTLPPIRILSRCVLRGTYPEAIYDQKSQQIKMQTGSSDEFDVAWRKFHGCLLFEKDKFIDFFIIFGDDYNDRLWCSITSRDSDKQTPVEAVRWHYESHKRKSLSLGSSKVSSSELGLRVELERLEVCGVTQILLKIEDIAESSIFEAF